MLTNKSIIISDFRPLSGTHTVAQAKARMNEEGLQTLPVVDETTQKLIGQLSLSQLEQKNDNQPLSDLEPEEPVKIYLGQHLFEAARLMLQYEIRVLPVIDQQGTYQGILCKPEVLESLSKMLNLADFGSVITVELDRNNFTISEIVQLIETERAKILGMTVEKPGEDDLQFEVSFKLNIKDVSRVAEALRRFGYNVITQSGTTVLEEDLEERADELLNYINI